MQDARSKRSRRKDPLEKLRSPGMDRYVRFAAKGAMECKHPHCWYRTKKPAKMLNHVCTAHPNPSREGVVARELKPLDASAVLGDSFVPASQKKIFLQNIDDRWNACRGPPVMETLIQKLSHEMIPWTPGLSKDLFQPPACHEMKPDLTLISRPTISCGKADLDETSSISEYVSTFRSALMEEHRAKCKAYEAYTVYSAIRMTFNPKRPHAVSIAMNGISDARPGLSVGDIVLIRPIDPVMTYVRHLYPNGMVGNIRRPSHIEIETKVLSINRGRRGALDTVTFDWCLGPEKAKALTNASTRSFAVRFIPHSRATDKCMTALDWLEGLNELQQSLVQGVLFPVSAPVVSPLKFEQRQLLFGSDIPNVVGNCELKEPLNEKQSDFVRMARARMLDASNVVRPPIILTGPAGVGKTKTLIYTIADLLGLTGSPCSSEETKNPNRILLCAPSHLACNVLTTRLAAIGLENTQIFRLFEATRPIETIPMNVLPFTCQGNSASGFLLPPPSSWVKLKVVVCTCLDAHILFKSRMTNSVIRTKAEGFHSFLAQSHSQDLLGYEVVENDARSYPFFTHLFIDEGAQATEPELLIPLSCVLDPSVGSHPQCEIAICGDPRQLSPQIYSNNFDSLGRSFLERLLRRPVTALGGGEASLLGPVKSSDLIVEGASSLVDLIRYYHKCEGQEQLTIFLTENYRGHISHLMMPSAFFYFDRLTSASHSKLSTDDDYWTDKLRSVEMLSKPVEMTVPMSPASQNELLAICRQPWPVHFCGVRGEDRNVSIENFATTDGWQNLEEANLIVDMVKALVADGVDQARVGVMSAFRGQVTLMRQLLRKEDLFNVNVGTIENFQGAETPVVIFSITRAIDFVKHDVANRIGVLGRPKKANVAMTRAKNLFIVVGNPDLLWKDDMWRQWLRFMFRNGRWYGVGLDQWHEKTISLDGMEVVATMSEAEESRCGGEDKAVVVSTLEKINRTTRFGMRNDLWD